MPFSISAFRSRIGGSWKLWPLAALSAILLELPFPMAAPLPAWRSIFAWFALAPLLAALASASGGKRPLRTGFFVAYFSGALWYLGNCYWVRDTMQQYGDMPPFAPELILLAFSLYLGLYFGLFGLLFAAIRKGTGSLRIALAAAPFLWIATELAAARITSFPWDQLGYTQIDNGFLMRIAPWTGVYGISFLLMTANALLAGAFLIEQKPLRRISAACGAVLTALGFLGICASSPVPAPSATAVLVQPNLNVGGEGLWSAHGEWERHMADFTRLSSQHCKSYIAGLPETGAATGETVCPPYVSHPDLVVWPESPAPFFEDDARFQRSLLEITHATQAPLVVGMIGMDLVPDERLWHEYNSALVLRADGLRLGRYDKIHLVPFGEYVPFQQFLTFARKLTGQVSRFDRGTERKVFLLGGHRYGMFICYEAVFADEVREFAKNGAEVFVNVSDDAWYGDTSAPWQHLNMARMRAIENRRWILRSTNNGVTAAIDPYGRVRQSIPRHAADALPASYGFNSATTFYTRHGDWFAWFCAGLTFLLAGGSLWKIDRSR